MASSPGAVSTPETTPQRATTTSRSFTVPSKLSSPNSAQSTSTETTRETLYNHPAAHIFKFKPPKSQTSSNPQPFSSSSSSAGTLPWASPAEHTVASGQLEIYRAPSSGTFLRCGGKFEHQILPRSPFWCVDGVRKFVCRAREPDTFYRVELPAETEEEVSDVEKFVTTLKKICYYERTPCPFSRTFTVDLPEEPEVRPKRRKRNADGTKVIKWNYYQAYGWKQEGWEPRMAVEGEDEDTASASASGSSEDDSEAASSGQEEGDEVAEQVKDTTASPSARTRAIRALRSVSEPQDSHVHYSTSPAKSRTSVDVDGTADAGEVAGGDNGEQDAPSLRSFQAIPTDMPPSPPDSSAGLDYLENRGAQVASSVDVESEVEMRNALELRSAAGVESAVENQHTLAGAERMGLSSLDTAHSQSGSDVIDKVEDTAIEYVEPDSTRRSSDTSPLPPQAEARDVESVDVSTEKHNDEFDQPVELVHADEATTRLEDKGEADSSRSSQPDDQQPGEVREEDMSQRESLRDQHQAKDDGEEDTAQHISFEDPPKREGEETRDSLQPALPEEQNHLQDEEREDTSQSALPEDEQQREEDTEDGPPSPLDQINPEDPYAAIQARILARRSLSGTTFLNPLTKSSTRSSTSSLSSSSAVLSNKSSRTSRGRRRQRDATTHSLYSYFLGPPAQLLATMLRVAARFANGAFGVDSMFYVESPVDSPRKVPGSYNRLRGDSVEEMSSDEEGGLDWEDEEDDFGVPLNRPASNLAELRRRNTRGSDVD